MPTVRTSMFRFRGMFALRHYLVELSCEEKERGGEGKKKRERQTCDLTISRVCCHRLAHLLELPLLQLPFHLPSSPLVPEARSHGQDGDDAPSPQ